MISSPVLLVGARKGKADLVSRNETSSERLSLEPAACAPHLGEKSGAPTAALLSQTDGAKYF